MTQFHPPEGAAAVQVIRLQKLLEHSHPPVRSVNESGAHNDDQINRTAEEEVRAVLDHLIAQDEALAKMFVTLAVRMNGNSKA
jgi:hypothetical protein